jgi:pentatricopeptide repeat protein
MCGGWQLRFMTCADVLEQRHWRHSQPGAISSNTDIELQAGHLAYACLQAAEELARGQQQGWAANAQVYEAMITALCDKDHLSDAIDTFNRMKVPPRMQAEDSPDRQLCIVCPAMAQALNSDALPGRRGSFTFS